MSKSIILFLGMGLMVVVGLVVSFVILPSMDERSGTYGSEGVVLGLPVMENDLRFSSFGINGFCIDRRNSLDFEVSNDTQVVSSIDGPVTKVSDGVVRVEPSSGIYVDYSVLSNIRVSVNDYVTKGDVLGSVEGGILHLYVINYMDRLYECPYRYMSEEVQGIVDDSMERAENGGSVCSCTTIKF